MKSSSRSSRVFRNTHAVAPGLKRHRALTTWSTCAEDSSARRPRRCRPEPAARGWAGLETGLRATWLGHSTVLVEIDGVRVLTDPVWGERASPTSFAGPSDSTRPVPISSLPALDAVIISHDHYDHLDYPTILELARLDVPFITSLGVGAHLEAWGVPAERITELDWWERTPCRAVK